MKNASESLADVRKWICDNLSNGDAGRLCNMLSSVSRHISEIETKNKHLHYDYVDKIMYISTLEQKIVCMDDENVALKAKLNCMRDELNDWKSTHVKLPKDGEAPSKQLAEWIENRGLVTGPLDADGELWHRGDMSDSPWGEIESIAFYGHQWQVSGHDTSAPWIPADSISHYHAPTVEDVLREMLDAWGELPSNATNDAIVAEYAAKLRLAGDAK